MQQEFINEANRLKQKAGQELAEQLTLKFNELLEEGIISSFKGKTNFRHPGYAYPHQYKTNFIIETLDQKLIIINSSNSYRQDRVKQDNYDFQGINDYSEISDRIIASILLFPDEEFGEKSQATSYRNKVKRKYIYSAATHILSLSELLEFLDNHKSAVEIERASEEEQTEVQDKDGSYYGKKGNAFEKEVVRLLSNYTYLRALKSNSDSDVDPLYSMIVSKLASDIGLPFDEIISIEATDTVTKLASGGSAKTDVVVKLKTPEQQHVKTISIKNTTQSRVSCHDYKAEDFIRVLGVENTELENYLNYYQEAGSHKKFEQVLPTGLTTDEFESSLQPYTTKLIEWALKGEHDHLNLIEPKTQISEYILINKNDDFRFSDYDSYIDQIKVESKLVYGTPFNWTHPSKQRGRRIQLKMPIIL